MPTDKLVKAKARLTRDAATAQEDHEPRRGFSRANTLRTEPKTRESFGTSRVPFVISSGPKSDTRRRPHNPSASAGRLGISRSGIRSFSACCVAFGRRGRPQVTRAARIWHNHTVHGARPAGQYALKILAKTA